ncbi:MAG: 4-hydroxy-tetrahydrodipicolinate reductase [Ruminococcaceae bacterium]|nr:4-hydroxy-tetrahydrodipicolinate reductase [Oscillospiraceae bacterium]
MTRILLSGCCGKMGRFVASAVAGRKDCEIVAGIDIVEDSTLGFPVFSNYDEVQVKADVIVDFSNPSLLPAMLDYAVKTSTGVVLATTGLTDEQIKTVEDAGKSVPVFFSYNMSIGVSLLCELSKVAAKVLGNGFDVEIVEAHHNQKLDAPSGTAIMLGNAIKEEMPDAYFEYDRHSKREKRHTNEIGIHSVRGGTIVGEHEVIFAGNDEIVKLSHSARSRAIFANGAVNAAVFLKNKETGVYNMTDLVNE